ncbi:hypothetical protein C8R43DRAFT_950784 [Mycena crocata]|nr:hypothetical protein C8R43DRAFT_950784 [Mycena crocata]
MLAALLITCPPTRLRPSYDSLVRNIRPNWNDNVDFNTDCGTLNSTCSTSTFNSAASITSNIRFSFNSMTRCTDSFSQGNVTKTSICALNLGLSRIIQFQIAAALQRSIISHICESNTEIIAVLTQFESFIFSASHTSNTTSASIKYTQSPTLHLSTVALRCIASSQGGQSPASFLQVLASSLPQVPAFESRTLRHKYILNEESVGCVDLLQHNALSLCTFNSTLQLVPTADINPAVPLPYLVEFRDVPGISAHFGNTSRLHDVSRSHERGELVEPDALFSRNNPPEANIRLYLQCDVSIHTLLALGSTQCGAAAQWQRHKAHDISSSRERVEQLNPRRPTRSKFCCVAEPRTAAAALIPFRDASISLGYPAHSPNTDAVFPGSSFQNARFGFEFDSAKVQVDVIRAQAETRGTGSTSRHERARPAAARTHLACIPPSPLPRPSVPIHPPLWDVHARTLRSGFRRVRLGAGARSTRLSRSACRRIPRAGASADLAGRLGGRATRTLRVAGIRRDGLHQSRVGRLGGVRAATVTTRDTGQRTPRSCMGKQRRRCGDGVAAVLREFAGSWTRVRVASGLGDREVSGNGASLAGGVPGAALVLRHYTPPVCSLRAARASPVRRWDVRPKVADTTPTKSSVDLCTQAGMDAHSFGTGRGGGRGDCGDGSWQAAGGRVGGSVVVEWMLIPSRSASFHSALGWKWSGNERKSP